MSGQTGDCKFEHPHPDHPCALPADQPGDPCRHCAAEGVHRIVPETGHCVCVISVDDLSFADLKGLFAGINLSLRKEQPDV